MKNSKMKATHVRIGATLLLATALLTATGCEKVKLEEDNLCITREGYTVDAPPGIPSNLPLHGTITPGFSFDISNYFPRLGNGALETTGEMFLTKVRLRPTSPGASLSFLEKLGVQITGADSATLPVVSIVGDELGSPSTVDGQTQFPVKSTVNLYSYLSSGPIHVKLILTGTVPMLPLTLDATACFSVDASLKASLSKLIQGN